MAEFMADGADSAEFVSTVQLGSAGIGVDENIADGQPFPVIGTLQVPFVGPDGFLFAAVGFTLAGIEDIDLVHFAVSVPVVVLVIHVTCGQSARFRNHFARSSVGVFPVDIGIAAVVSTLVAQFVGAFHVETEVETAVALCHKVVVDAAFYGSFLIVFLIDQLVKRLPRMDFFKFDILEVDQQDESFLLAFVGRRAAVAPQPLHPLPGPVVCPRGETAFGAGIQQGEIGPIAYIFVTGFIYIIM